MKPDANDSETNSTNTVISLQISIKKMDSLQIDKNTGILLRQFRFALDNCIRYIGKTSSYSYTLDKGPLTTIHTTYESKLSMWIVASTYTEAIEIIDIVAEQFFLFVFQESLRGTPFQNAIIDSISEIQMIAAIPPS
ncbi:hypothetical protein RFI_39796 [Reticulomyxa filosa]|uniref:Uncharacterized protein n=1 Tax=Reticulomyxa filosa TaxID=46433 RepID=X6L8B5_RETFI|nr:hypothetical protein RFI_39796 [Reticulomyxa filosa]|eukprot:ETN97730.1 hypothetical protein RFI_39796 [Reticulomyxa filosa]